MDISKFQERIGYQFSNSNLLQKALVHRSYLNQIGGQIDQSFERLEFLGDSVLGFVVSEFLFLKFSNEMEGKLSKRRAKIVNEITLSECARKIELGAYILLSDEEESFGGRDRPSILADAFEAFLGALFLDGGIAAAKAIIYQFLLTDVDAIFASERLKDHKSALQEYTQRIYKEPPVYRVINETGPDHQKTFTIEALINGKRSGVGQGKNKKEAEQMAAKEALQGIREMEKNG